VRGSTPSLSIRFRITSPGEKRSARFSDSRQLLNNSWAFFFIRPLREPRLCGGPWPVTAKFWMEIRTTHSWRCFALKSCNRRFVQHISDSVSGHHLMVTTTDWHVNVIAGAMTKQ